MDFYSSKTPNIYRLIKGIFIMIGIATLVVTVLFFTLSIHETAKAKDGEVVAENTSIEYLAPLEAEVQEVLVQEGTRVNKGDTLIVLHNAKLLADYKKTKNSLATVVNNIEIYKKQLDHLLLKIERQKKGITILNSKYKLKKRGTSYEVNSIQEQLKVLEGKMEISKNNANKNYQLLQNGAISQKEYYKRYQSYLDETNNLSKMKNEAYQQVNNNNNIDTDFDGDINKNELEVLNTKSEYLNHQKTLEQEEAKEKELMAKLETQLKDLNDLTIISEIDGYATSLYNTQKDVNLVLKKQALLIVTPLSEEKFYANFTISEKEIKDIQIGQTVHIKMDAYDHYKYGILKGTVTHINKEMSAEKKKELGKELFYVLVDIPDIEDNNMNIKSGFKVTGEIIIRKVKLYQFFFKSMFKKI